jgi:hydroxymethylpyrimidine/phosphomethylpyrimidine kinase
MQPTSTIPAVLCAAGHDPCGGAGIAADGEAIRAAGAHALSVITCLTSQDTCGLRRLWPQPPDQVDEQCRLLMADARVSAIKVGLLGSAALARVLTRLVREHPDLPLVVDPVLASGAGQSVADAALCNQLRQHLLPAATLITPNLPEAQTLTGAIAADDCAQRLLRLGGPWVLITGTHAPGEAVTNRLYGRDGIWLLEAEGDGRVRLLPRFRRNVPARIRDVTRDSRHAHGRTARACENRNRSDQPGEGPGRSAEFVHLRMEGGCDQCREIRDRRH